MATITTSPIPAQAEAEYRGKWIAIRNGEVVAEAARLEDLVSLPKVQKDDVLYHVPHRSATFF
jgi:hypothetical protein